MDLAGLSHHVINLELCGPVSVYIQGDLEKQRDSTVFLTVHDVGSSYTSWVQWVMDDSMEEVRKRSVFVHVALPGQELGAGDKPVDWIFPSMKDIGLNLVTILDNLRIQRVVGLGDGAGANIITRFGMFHPSRVLGIVVINNTATSSMGRFMDRLAEKMKAVKGDAKALNQKNVAMFAEAYRKRTQILEDLNKKIDFDVLLIAGMKSKYVQDTEVILKEMAPGLCSMIKVEEVSEPLTEAPDKVSEAVLLFCQGIGLLPSAPRRLSRQSSASDSRKTSMAISEKLYLDPALKHHVVDLDSCGPVSIFLQGDLEKQREGVVFLTVHDVGSTYMSWKYFVTDVSMDDVRKRSLFIHVAIPGQEPGASDLSDDFGFPKIKDLGLSLVSILDSLRIRQVIGIGDGAGANIITRFAMCHPSRVHGICTINNTATASLGRFMDRIKDKMKAEKQDGRHSLNKKNLSKFAEAYQKRTEILQDLNKKINVDVLLIAGMKSKYIQDTETIHKEMAPGLSSMIKVEDVSEPLTETPARVAEAVLLFCQGLGLLSSAPRRPSRQNSSFSNGSSGDNRKTSTSSDLSEKLFRDPTLAHHIVELDGCGPISVFLQGDLENHRDGVVFLTVHDVGDTYFRWRNFVDTQMQDIKERALFIHVAIPGQEPGAGDLQQDFNFPTMKDLGLNLVSLLDHLRIPRVIGLGDGAGANIITRFGMCHPSRVFGIFTINNTATASLGRFMDRLKEKMKAAKSDESLCVNQKNVSKFADKYKKRTEIIQDLNKKVNFDVLLMAGMKSKYVKDTESIHKEMAPGLCSMIKIEDVSEPLTETPDRVSEAILLFCQGMGLLPTINRKVSLQGSVSSSGSFDKGRMKSLSLEEK